MSSTERVKNTIVGREKIDETERQGWERLFPNEQSQRQFCVSSCIQFQALYTLCMSLQDWLNENYWDFVPGNESRTTTSARPLG